MKKEIVRIIKSIAGRYSVYEVFGDWIKMLAISISNSVDYIHSAEREKEYLELAKKYTQNELKKISGMSGILTLAMEEEMEDVLGWIYHHLELHGKQLGQFFTPYHLCRLMAEITEPVYNENGYISINEPAVGAGGNIIAFCEKLKKDGINYQQCVKVVGQDLDWKCVYMSYVQFSLYGVPAIVVQGDTLAQPYVGGFGSNVYVTPAYITNPYISLGLKLPNDHQKENWQSEIDRLIKQGQQIQQQKTAGAME